MGVENQKEDISKEMEKLMQEKPKKKKGKKKWIFLGVFLLLLLFVIKNLLFPGKAQGLKVSTEELKKGNIEEKLSVSLPGVRYRIPACDFRSPCKGTGDSGERRR